MWIPGSSALASRTAFFGDSRPAKRAREVKHPDSLRQSNPKPGGRISERAREGSPRQLNGSLQAVSDGVCKSSAMKENLESREGEPQELFTASQVARFCRVDLKTIHNW